MKEALEKKIDISPAEFEDLVREILSNKDDKLVGFKTEIRHEVQGSDGKYEIDVLAEFEALGAKFVVVVECKRHKSSVKREVVQVLYDRLRSIGAQKAMLFSTSNFQSGAVEYAKSHGVALVRVLDGSTTYVTKGASGPIKLPDWVPKYACWEVKQGETGPTYNMLTKVDPWNVTLK